MQQLLQMSSALEDELLAAFNDSDVRACVLLLLPYLHYLSMRCLLRTFVPVQLRPHVIPCARSHGRACLVPFLLGARAVPALGCSVYAVVAVLPQHCRHPSSYRNPFVPYAGGRSTARQAPPRACCAGAALHRERRVPGRAAGAAASHPGLPVRARPVRGGCARLPRPALRSCGRRAVAAPVQGQVLSTTRSYWASRRKGEGIVKGALMYRLRCLFLLCPVAASKAACVRASSGPRCLLRAYLLSVGTALP